MIWHYLWVIIYSAVLGTIAWGIGRGIRTWWFSMKARRGDSEPS